MATQKRAVGADLWFVTLDDSGKVAAAVFLEVNTPQPVVLFELVKGWMTGSTPKLGEMHRIGPSQD